MPARKRSVSPSPKRAAKKSPKKVAHKASPSKSIRKSTAAKPKRAKNAYIYFYNKSFSEIRSKYPTLPITELSRKAASRWHAMTPTKRRPFEELAKKDKMRADKERKVIKDSKPTRDPTEYQRWAAKNRVILKKKHPEMDFGQISAKLGNLWRKR